MSNMFMVIIIIKGKKNIWIVMVDIECFDCYVTFNGMFYGQHRRYVSCNIDGCGRYGLRYSTWWIVMFDDVVLNRWRKWHYAMLVCFDFVLILCSLRTMFMFLRTSIFTILYVVGSSLLIISDVMASERHMLESL